MGILHLCSRQLRMERWSSEKNSQQTNTSGDCIQSHLHRTCTKHLNLAYAIRNHIVRRTFFRSNVTTKALTARTAPNADRRILRDAASARSSQLWSTSPAASRAYQWGSLNYSRELPSSIVFDICTGLYRGRESWISFPRFNELWTKLQETSNVEFSCKFSTNGWVFQSCAFSMALN